MSAILLLFAALIVTAIATGGPIPFVLVVFMAVVVIIVAGIDALSSKKD